MSKERSSIATVMQTTDIVKCAQISKIPHVQLYMYNMLELGIQISIIPHLLQGQWSKLIPTNGT